MPAPKDWTPEAALARVVKDRERARLGMRELRQRRRVTGTGVSVTHKKEGRVTPTPLPPHPSPPESSTNSPLPAVARLNELLEGFGRGYKPAPTRLAKLLRDFPLLDVEEEVADALDWLERPENRKRVCSVGYLRKWCAKSEADRVAGPAPRPSNGTTNGTYHPPVTRQRTPDPEGLPVFQADLERVALPPRRGGTLREKLAAIKGARR